MSISPEFATPLCLVSRQQRRALIPLALAFVAVALPYLWTHAPVIAFAVQHAFSLVCHQRPERSFWVFGGPVAVCARCLGIYLGAAVGLLLRMPRRVALGIFFAAAAVNVIDCLSEFAGLHGNWLDMRFLLGFLLGATGAIVVSSAIQKREVKSKEGRV
jgi:uncharacterized membrane protein